MRALAGAALLLALMQLAAAGTAQLATQDQLYSKYIYWCTSAGGAVSQTELRTTVEIPAGSIGNATVEISASAYSRGLVYQPYEMRLYLCDDAGCGSSKLIASQEFRCGAGCGWPCDNVVFRHYFQAQQGVRHYRLIAYNGGYENVKLASARSRAWIEVNAPPTRPLFTSPTAGSTVEGRIRAEWTASADPEGAQVAYELELLRSPGWQRLADTTAARFDIDSASLGAGTQRLRVRASDGYSESEWSETHFTVRGAVGGEWLQAAAAKLGEEIQFAQEIYVHGADGGIEVEAHIPEGGIPASASVLAPDGSGLQAVARNGTLYWNATSDGAYSLTLNMSAVAAEAGQWEPLVAPSLSEQRLRATVRITNPNGLRMLNLSGELPCPEGMECNGTSVSISSLEPHQSQSITVTASGDALSESWGAWSQDFGGETAAGGLAFIARGLTVGNRLNQTITVPLNGTGREGWNCTSPAEVEVPALGLAVEEFERCGKAGVIEVERGPWLVEEGTLTQRARVRNNDLELWFEVGVEADLSGADGEGLQKKTVRIAPGQTAEVVFSLAQEGSPEGANASAGAAGGIVVTGVRQLDDYSSAGGAVISLPDRLEPGVRTIGVFIDGSPANGTLEITSPSGREYERELGEDGTTDFDFDEDGNWTVGYGNSTRNVTVRKGSGQGGSGGGGSASKITGFGALNIGTPSPPLLALLAGAAALAYVARARLSSIRLLKRYRKGKVELFLRSRSSGLKEIELTDIAPEDLAPPRSQSRLRRAGRPYSALCSGGGRMGCRGERSGKSVTYSAPRKAKSCEEPS